MISFAFYVTVHEEAKNKSAVFLFLSLFFFFFFLFVFCCCFFFIYLFIGVFLASKEAFFPEEIVVTLCRNAKWQFSIKYNRKLLLFRNACDCNLRFENN